MHQPELILDCELHFISDPEADLLENRKTWRQWRQGERIRRLR